MSTTTTDTARQHIASTSGVCGGKPCIAGTRIRVQDIYVWHELQSQGVDEIVTKFPQLTHADVYAALAYLWDHRQEIVAEMQRGDAFVEAQALKYPSKLQGKIKRLGNADPISPG
jgi:uncharacterized protein (DUF433 family)